MADSEEITEEEKVGVKMIQDLQGFAGIKETDEEALRGWREMTKRARVHTKSAHSVLFSKPIQKNTKTKNARKTSPDPDAT